MGLEACQSPHLGPLGSYSPMPITQLLWNMWNATQGRQFIKC